MTADPAQGQKKTRPRGRPRLDIDPNDVADAVAELFAEGGLEAVSILDTAEKLSVSRATLYRTVPTKDHLIGILFERSSSELTESAQAVISSTEDPADQLLDLVRIQIGAAIRMRRYMPVFFGGGDLPPEVFERRHEWSRSYEEIWVDVVRANVESGRFSEIDPVITARLLLGSCIWVSRWYRPNDDYDAEAITETAIALVERLQGTPSRQKTPKPAKKTATKKAAFKKATGRKAADKKASDKS